MLLAQMPNEFQNLFDAMKMINKYTIISKLTRKMMKGKRNHITCKEE